MDIPDSDAYNALLNNEYFSGHDTLAYIKPVATDHGKAYAVCDQHGTTLALFSSQDAAFYAAKQHDLEPALIH